MQRPSLRRVAGAMKRNYPCWSLILLFLYYNMTDGRLSGSGTVNIAGRSITISSISTSLLA
jgi:hypothetical protein